jgi:YggT family protein
MLSLLRLIDLILSIIWWTVIASAIASWLVAFGVVNTRNRGVYLIIDMLNRLTEPLLRPIRRIIPQFGGLDISPMVLLLGIYFLQSLLHEYAYPAVLGAMYSG